MSIIISKIESISKSTINTSTAKQRYSFGKASRFMKKREQVTTEFFYDISPKKEARSTNLGHGKRFDFTNTKNKNDSPYYYFDSSFKIKPELKRKDFFTKSQAYYKKNFDDNLKRINDSFAEPKYYNVSQPLGKDAKKISISFKLNNSYNNIKESMNKPGPGTYSNFNLSVLSKSQNVRNISFNKAKRFTSQKTCFNNEVLPGPGHYKSISTFNSSGFYPLSNYKSGTAKSLSWKNYTKNKIDDVPGPGYYKVPSDFGIYVSKFSTVDSFYNHQCKSKFKQSQNSTINNNKSNSFLY